ncbi:MAG: hypothetical protein JOZ27_02710, partial [Caulobacteraceae bacterium]|nr:hypothetical protein [Caulobacteraceae bacterium]
IEASIFGEGRASDEAQVFFALRLLLGRICADLARCGKRAGALRLAVELEDADARDFDVPLAVPTAHERTLFDLLRAKLEGATFAAAIVGLRLAALQLEEGGEEQTLFAADDFDAQRVAVTIARLEAALGEHVSRAKTRDAHLLEERFVYEPFTMCHPERTLRLAALTQDCAPAALGEKGMCHPERSAVGAQSKDEGRKDGLVPQLRLLQVREIPVRVRRGEPSIVDRVAVRQCTGPWRIAERPHAPVLSGAEGRDPVTRDEYDVVLENGTFARIYHQGSHWYLRGVYE